MAQINKPNTYFNTVTYTGNGSTQSITGVGFQPDLIWSKGRSIAGFDHSVTDSVRGNTKRIFPSRTDGDVTCTVAVTSFDSDGFSLGNDNCATLANLNNYNTQTYVNWLWKASGTTASNTDGSITSTVSANTTSGFSIVKWTNNTSDVQTIGHGLGVKPDLIILKTLTLVQDWRVYTSTYGANYFLKLNATDAVATASSIWNNTEPTTNVFTTGTGSQMINNTLVAYCFNSVKGFSKFGSYTGNGSADGTFIYTGFKPSFVMHKRTDSANNWIIQDNKRVGYNADNRILKANLSDAEQGVHEMDFVSNGFKIRTTGLGSNASGGTYIYMAFAENPLVGTNNIPATAR